jgi:hypothetical protein
VSLTNGEQLGNGDSGLAFGESKADVSDDGRYVFFTSAATNLGSDNDTNAKTDIFRRDRAASNGGSTGRVSLDGAAQLNGDSSQVDASGNGRYVVWRTMATNLPGIDTNGAGDIAFRDLNFISPQKVSIGIDADVDGSSLRPTVSDNGDLIAFQSTASDLVSGDTNNVADVFTRRRSTSTTTRVSVGPEAAQLLAGASLPDMTPDGTRISFATFNSAVAGDVNGKIDLFVREAGANTLVSRQGDGTPLEQDVTGGAVSDDDAAWLSTDRGVSSDINNVTDAYVRHTPFLSTFTTIDDFVPFQLGRFTGTTPTAEDTALIRARLRSGASPYTWLLSLADDPSFSATRAPVVRLYWAYFKRRPDLAGMNFWINRYRSGWTLSRISQEFAKSSEFRTKYGNTTPEQFVTLVYQSVLEREPEPGGFAYWVDRIRTGTPRGQVMTNFSESSEGRRIIGPRTDVILLGLGMYGKIPSKALFDGIVAERMAGEVREVALAYLLGAPEYIATLP